MSVIWPLIALLAIWPLPVMAFTSDQVDWNHGLQRIQFNAPTIEISSPFLKVTTLGVRGSILAVGFGKPGSGVSQTLNLANGTTRQPAADERASFNPLPVESGNFRVAIETGNKIVLYDRSIATPLRDGFLYRPHTVGIADSRFILVPQFNNGIAVYETNGGYLGMLAGNNDDGIAMLAGDGNLVAAATFSGTVYLRDEKKGYGVGMVK